MNDKSSRTLAGNSTKNDSKSSSNDSDITLQLPARARRCYSGKLNPATSTLYSYEYSVMDVNACRAATWRQVSRREKGHASGSQSYSSVHGPIDVGYDLGVFFMRKTIGDRTSCLRRASVFASI